ncbi:hypothetical protein GCM10008995_03370 [Halobellus salinus]|uniref:Uncharacterized protein n=1 Tax=Halobellus salinus TaxID=931585 RepID=A0A830E6B3_9EURY|nr:hypothetical protein [Halobellus salinus]GGI96674.1 hypothetical protein GCM10008995_03370 [Halobellus salinus]SMP13374.1 hypothetical protein SAMN06265347_104186 [Halobellus salinus]
MRGPHLGAGIVVASVLLAVVAAGPAAAQTVDPADEAEICPGTSGDSLVVVLPGDTYVRPGGDATLLPGTEAEIALCSDGGVVSTTAWPVDGGINGVTVGESERFSYPVTVEAVEGPTPVEFAPAIGQRGDVATPTVTAAPGNVTTIGVGGSTYRVAVAADNRDRLRRANNSYTETRNGMRTAAADLAENAGRLDPAPDIPDDRRLPQINRTRAVTTNYSTIQSRLFNAAANGDTGAVAALDAYERQHNDALGETRDSLETANRAIERQARSTALGVLGDLLGVALAGAVVGGIGGRVLTDRILSQVEIDRRRSSAVDFRPKHLAVQLGVAVVLVAGAVALVVTQGLLDPLVAVIRAVIGV